MEKGNGKKTPILRVERSFIKVVDSLSPETGEEVIPEKFTKTVGHTCCVPDCIVVNKINNADSKKTALRFAEEENLSIAQAQRAVNFYYSLST